MGQLSKIESELINLGYQVLAVSPDRPETLRESASKQDLRYRLLSDRGMAVARAFGIAFSLDDETVGNLRRYGINLEATSGEDDFQLPVPSVFLVDTGGTIRFRYFDPDHKVRIEPEALLAAAAAAAE